MYARLMHQFKMYAENPEKEIARDERPNLDLEQEGYCNPFDWIP